MRWVHVADERVAVLDYDLPATRHIGASDLSYVFADTKLRRIAVSLAHKVFLQFELSKFFYQAGYDAVNWNYGRGNDFRFDRFPTARDHYSAGYVFLFFCGMMEISL